VPGIGKKTSERIVLELKDKVNSQWMVSQGTENIKDSSDLMEALLSLGYSASEAAKAVASLPNSVEDLEERLKLALKYFNDKSNQ